MKRIIKSGKENEERGEKENPALAEEENKKRKRTRKRITLLFYIVSSPLKDKEAR